MDSQTGSPSLQPVEDGTVRRRVTQRLSYHIITGGFEPGQRLTEQDLAQSLGVSRGSVREAVRELVQAGLLESLPYRGLYVRSISRQNLEELYSLRTMLERFAFERLWSQRTEEGINDLEARNRTLIETVETGADGLLAIEQELHLHSWCYEQCGHGMLKQTWEGIRPHIHFYFALHQKAHNRKGPLRRSHDLYVQLAKEDDLSEMLLHLNDHMKQGLETTMTALSDQLTA